MEGKKEIQYQHSDILTIAKEKGYGIDIRDNNIAEIEANR